MPKITYIQFNGKEHRIDVPVGKSVMWGARQNDIDGIDADCGGGCSCATCHVYVDNAWFEKSGEKSETEEMLLDTSEITKPNSRLSCQIIIDETHEGLIIHLPEWQH